MARDAYRDSRVTSILQMARLADIAKRLGISVSVRGGRATCLCPFHDDTQPSMVLYDESDSGRHYHCFACNQHGDVFNLVQHVKGITFSESVDWLAGVLAIAGQARTKGRRDGTFKEPKTEPRRRGLELASEIFSENSDPVSLELFARERQIGVDFLAGVGVTAVHPGVLTRHLANQRSQGDDWRTQQGLLEEAGLVRVLAHVASPTRAMVLDLREELTEFYRDSRIIFSIHNRQDQIEGFAGRRTVNDPQNSSAKYLFSPGFKKSNALYRVSQAAEAIRKKRSEGELDSTLYITEGLLDALRLEVNGIPAVSILGAQLSEQQIGVLRLLQDEAGSSSRTSLGIFLDRDKAGLRGAAKSIVMLAKAGLDAKFVWPLNADLAKASVNPSAKDPDQIFAEVSETDHQKLLVEWTHSPALALLADFLGATPDDIVDDDTWKSYSLSRRLRAFDHLIEAVPDYVGILDPQFASPTSEPKKWFRDAREYLQRRQGGEDGEWHSKSYMEDVNARLNLARSLARSGAQRGDMAQDVAMWRRIDLAATAFNAGIASRLQQAMFSPLEPFDSIYVSRGFGKTEHRLKVMPCPEDLIAQQYLMGEVLTERYDRLGRAKFSSRIPAVRYFRESDATVTTGTSNAPTEDTLSFAYQIDMDVLEGRQPESSNGMFRPYFDCWRDFIRHLRRCGTEMEQVYVLRLDVRKYYDEITKLLVRDVLRTPFAAAIGGIEDSAAWAPLFRSGGARTGEIGDALVDWICDQSFGFTYYGPDNGEPRQAQPDKGIPQGPALSAWLGTIALFPLDEAMRQLLGVLNASDDDRPRRAAYARYVDDVVLIAESSEVLSALRARAEDVAKQLALQLVQKTEPVPVMTADEFAAFLTIGRAFAASEPDAEPAVFSAGDGESGWQTYEWEEITDFQRNTSLQLLHDQRLYDADFDRTVNQLYTALRAKDLRPKELAKASRWLWYQAALDTASQEDDRALVEIYCRGWTRIIQDTEWRLDPIAAPWEDPAFFALEGLEKILETPFGGDRMAAGHPGVATAVLRLAKATVGPGFFSNFLLADDQYYPPGWGAGTSALRRMFWSHALPLRAKAVRLMGPGCLAATPGELEVVDKSLQDLRPFLTRALLSYNESRGEGILPAQQGQTENPIRHAFLHLHEIIVLLSYRPASNDPLLAVGGGLTSLDGISVPARFRVVNDEFVPLLRYLHPATYDAPGSRVEGNAARLALATLGSIGQRTELATLLKRRPVLLRDTFGAVPLPTLPGVPGARFVLANFDDGAGSLRLVRELTILDAGPGDQEQPVDQITVASRIGEAFEVSSTSADWESISGTNLDDVSMLKAYRADISALQLLAYETLPHVLVSARLLRWVALVFDGLAKLTFESSISFAADDEQAGDGDDCSELVPAWPFVAVSSAPDSASDLTVSLLLVRAKRSELGNLAFLRDGMRGLRPVEVPSEDASLWRIGVALSDITGFSEDVDKYQTTAESMRTSGGSLAEEVLVQSLRRLRGCFSGHYVSRPSRVRPHLPASVHRVLVGLEEFENEQAGGTSLSFAIAMLHETQSMANRLSECPSVAAPGELAAFYTRSAIDLLGRLPNIVLDELPAPRPIDAGLRKHVQAWHLFLSRLELQAPPATAHLDLSWRSLVAGTRVAAVSAWLQSIVLELLDEGSLRALRSVDLEVEVASNWQISDAVLFLKDDALFPGETVWGILDAATAGSHTHSTRAMALVTPLGWLAVAAARIGLFSGNGPVRLALSTSEGRAAYEELPVGLAGLASALATMPREEDVSLDGDGAEWPFEGQAGAIECFDDEFHESAVGVLLSLDTLLGNVIREVKGKSWPYERSRQAMPTADGTVRSLSPWRIRSVGSGRLHTRLQSGVYVTDWTETYNTENQLCGVGIWREPVPRIVGGLDGQQRLKPAPPKEPVIPSELVIGDREDSGHLASSFDAEVPRLSAESGDRAVDSLLGYQGMALARRKDPSQTHIRVAMLQWRVDDTYRHPMFDASVAMKNLGKALYGEAADGKDKELGIAIKELLVAARSDPAKSLELDGLLASEEIAASLVRTILDFPDRLSDWNRSARVSSWIEHRRRRILGKVLDACYRLDIDVLVLPEYSVRPDTVSWLAGQLKGRNIAFSVLAGTYRLHGSRDIPGFEKAYDGIFGFGDHQNVLEAHPSASKSGDKGSFLTLLVPDAEAAGRPREVHVFSRRKKYPAAAMGEVFNPSPDHWKPLFVLNDAVEQVAWLESKKVGYPTAQPSARWLLGYAQRHLPNQYIAELICSEIFLATSPANFSTLSYEYRQLLSRFGAGKTQQEADDIVAADILGLGASLSHRAAKRPAAQDSDSLFRRSVLLVPSMTSRSADYWIFGQSSLLAGGITTVFCNASCGKDSVGGTCAIGRNSWAFERARVPGVQSYDTPYSGWSRGIYYNSSEDALGKDEQALVVVDIDPNQMSEGKPRPQGQSVPLRLVAHLPLVETYTPSSDGDDKTQDAIKGIEGVALFNREKFVAAIRQLQDAVEGARGQNIWDPLASSTPGMTLLAAANEIAKFVADRKAFVARLEHWRCNWKDLPWAGPPPAVYDFIWVDHSLEGDEELPKVFVPPWS